MSPLSLRIAGVEPSGEHNAKARQTGLFDCPLGFPGAVTQGELAAGHFPSAPHGIISKITRPLRCRLSEPAKPGSASKESPPDNAQEM